VSEHKIKDRSKEWSEIKERFFRGEIYFRHGINTPFKSVWVARHKSYDTLTIEPIEGGQYEVAVRVFNKEEDQWEGYYLPSIDDIHYHFLCGVNTAGH